MLEEGLTKAPWAKGAVWAKAGDVVWMEHLLWEGKDKGDEPLGQQREVKIKHHQHVPDGVYFWYPAS
jgi:hypothetical protein